jgi:membrane protein
MSRFGDGYRAFDRFQQRHAWLGFPLAVRQKFAEDQGSYLAATIAYYGFFSIFPLLLVLVTALGYALRSDAGLERRVVDSALAQFPVIGQQLQVHGLKGSGLALVVGLLTALWAGMGVALAAENAFNHVWGVPFKHRPDPFRQRGKALLMLFTLGTASIVATFLAGIASAGDSLGLGTRIGGIVISLVVNSMLFLIAFRLLTTREVPWRDLRLGAAIAGVLWELLLLGGGYIVDHELKHASNVYGTFALVIGLLSWLYLGAQVTLLSAEANVVAARGLWPRSFSPIVEQPSTSADRQALRQRADVEERRQDQSVDVAFDGHDEGGDQAPREDRPEDRGRGHR